MGKEVQMFLDFYGPDRQNLSYSRGALSSSSMSQFCPLVHEDKAIHSVSRKIQELKKIPRTMKTLWMSKCSLRAGKDFLSLINMYNSIH